MIGRSFLFVPGNRPDRFDKARAAGADVALIDIEDAVAAGDKIAAGAALQVWLDRSKPVPVRTNGTDSDRFRDDLPLLAAPGVIGVMPPKAEDPAAIAGIRRVAPGLPVIALIESRRGPWNLMALASSGIARIAFGSIEFPIDPGIAGERDEPLFARSQIVRVSRLAGLPPATDIEWAQRVVAAASDVRDNAVRVDGKVVDRPVIERARAIVASARRGAK